MRGGFIGEADYAIEQGVVAGYQARRAADRARLGDAWSQRPEEDHEYHALLAQVIASPRPRFALAQSVIVPGIGGDSVSGRARARLLRGIMQWMRDHTACREMDPLTANAVRD